MNASTIDQIFDDYFSSIGDGIRDEQRIVIESVLASHNTLALMPTGGGKSLIYWIAGLALGGTTVVISPLTALMDEQALKLRSHGLSTLVLHSGMGSVPDQFRQLRQLYQGKMPDFLFTSPERMATDGFLEFVLRERNDQIRLFVIDEIHCISQWGHDFRPFYKEIPPFLDAVFGAPESWAPVLGLTATLNKKDTEQACSDFFIDSSHVYKSQYLLRYPIHIEVIKVTDEPEKDRLFWDRLERHRNDKVLIYIDNKKSGDRSTEGLSEKAQAVGYNAAAFHGDMTSEKKAEIIRQFKIGEVLTVFATSAFGMGIDIPDIRGVIHYRPPESVEQYYQQIGRVGRDRRPSWALIYYSDKNIDFRKRNFIDRSFPRELEIQEGFARLTAGLGAIQTFNYFGEYEAQAAFHYLLRSEAVNVLCKGIQKIDVFKRGKELLPQFDEYQDATRTGITVLAAKKTNIPVQALMEDLYRWYAKGKIELEKSPNKILIIEQLADELRDQTVAAIMDDAAEKKAYRYQLLDELAKFLDEYTNSITLHQQIGRYLGVDKFQLNRIHQTVSGEMVRSKSEVIIANLLTRHGVPFKYEERLEAGGYGFWPDFTVVANGKTYYWEHLGRLDLDQYRQNWEIKKSWYEEHFPGQLLTTVETSGLSRIAEETIKSTLVPDSAPMIPDVSVADQPERADRTGDNAWEEIRYRVKVWTEGQTDWKHLKSAFGRLKADGYFRNLEIDFQEDEEDMGERELLTMCRTFSRTRHTQPVIFLFDRDINLRDITETEQDYKDWGNNVYSVVLPVPEHRLDTPAISLEFYYQDEEIRREDENSRRLFIGTEFNPRNLLHESGQFVCTDRNKAGKFKIIDDQVYRVEKDTDENVAMTKNDFAENVLHGTSNFDDFGVSAFVELFELIEALASKARTEAGAG